MKKKIVLLLVVSLMLISMTVSAADCTNWEEDFHKYGCRKMDRALCSLWLLTIIKFE